MADQGVEALKADLRAQAKLQRENVPSSNPSIPAPAARPTFGGTIHTGSVVGESKYDKNIAVADIPSLDAIRHERQGVLAQTVNMLNQAVVGEIAGGMIEGVGYLLDISETFKTLGGKNEEWGNWMSDIGKGIKDWTREVTPIYKDPNASDFDPMSYSWWMSHMPSVASTISLMIPAVGTMTAVNKVAKIMKLGEKLVKTGRAVGMGDKGLKVANAIIQGTGTAIVSRHMESMMEATGTWKSVYDEALAKKVAEPQAKRMASDAAHTNYALNWVALAQDIPQYMLLGRTFPKLTTSSLKLGKQGSSTLFKPFNNKALAIGMDGVWEGVEEGYQFITDEESKYLVFQRAGLSKEEPFNDRLRKYTTDGEFWSAAAFGALGGILMQTAGKPISQAISGDPSAMRESFSNLKGRVSGVFGSKNSETGSTGVKDYEALLKVDDIRSWGSQYAAVQHHARRAIEWGSDQAKKTAGNEIIENLAIRAAETDKIQDLHDMLESMKNPSQEDLKTFGFDKMSEEEMRDFQKTIPEYQKSVQEIGQLWVELAEQLRKKGEFINSSETKSVEKVSGAIQLAVLNKRIRKTLQANNAEIVKIQEEVPQLQKSSEAVKSIVDAEIITESLKRMQASMKSRFDAGDMDGPEKMSYEAGFKELELAIAENEATQEEARKRLSAKDKKAITLIRGSARFPKYKELIGSNAVLRQTETINTYAEGALIRDIRQTAVDYYNKEDQVKKAAEVKKEEQVEKTYEQKLEEAAKKDVDNRKAVEDLEHVPGETMDLSAEPKTPETAEEQKQEQEQEPKPTNQDSLDDVISREVERNSEEKQDIEDNVETPQQTEEEEGQPEETPLLDGSPKEENETIFDTNVSDASEDMDTKIYGNLFAVELFPFDPGATFEAWANKMYGHQEFGASNLIRHISLLSSFVDTAIKEMESKGTKVPKELRDMASSLRTGTLPGNITPTVKSFIAFVNAYSPIAKKDLGVTGMLLRDAVANTYNYLFELYGPRQATTAAEIKDFHKKSKEKAVNDNRDYTKDPHGNNDSDTHFFTANPQYAMSRDKKTGMWFVLTNEDGLPITQARNAQGKIATRDKDGITQGDQYGELNWDKLNSGDFSGAKVYFEFDIGNNQGEVYNENPGDWYNHTGIPKYMEKNLPPVKGVNYDNTIATHVINNQNIWIVTYENNDLSGKRIVLGSLPAGTYKKNGTTQFRTNIMNLRAKLNREFTNEHVNGNIVSNVPSTSAAGQKGTAKTRFIRAQTTTKVDEQLPGRLHANPNPDKLISGKDILNVVPAEDLYLVIWNETANTFEGAEAILDKAAKDPMAQQVYDSLKDVNTTNLTNGATYMMLKSSKKDHYIPARVYNYIEPGSKHMNKIVNLIMTLNEKDVVWGKIKDRLKELMYSTYDIRPSGNSIIISHVAQDGKTVLRKIDLTQDSRTVRAQLEEVLQGRFAMISKYKINTMAAGGVSYNQLYMEGKESFTDEHPAPFIYIDITGAETQPNAQGQRVYTHSTKFKVAMPNMGNKIVVPEPARRESEEPVKRESEEATNFEERVAFYRKMNQMLSNDKGVMVNSRQLFIEHKDLGKVQVIITASPGVINGHFKTIEEDTYTITVKDKNGKESLVSLGALRPGTTKMTVYDKAGTTLETVLFRKTGIPKGFTQNPEEVKEYIESVKIGDRIELFFLGDNLTEIEGGTIIDYDGEIGVNFDSTAEGEQERFNTTLYNSDTVAVPAKEVPKEIPKEVSKETKKASPIISAEFTKQDTSFQIEVKGDKQDFLIIWDRNRAEPEIYSKKKVYEDGQVTYMRGDDIPTRKQVNTLIKKYVPAELITLMDKWLAAGNRPIGERLNAQDEARKEVEAYTAKEYQTASREIKNLADAYVRTGKDSTKLSAADLSFFNSLESLGLNEIFQKQIKIADEEYQRYMEFKREQSEKKADHAAKEGVQDNETEPNEELSTAEKMAKLRKAYNKTKDRGSSGTMPTDDERTMRMQRLRNSKEVMSEAEIDWFEKMFPGVPLEILETVNHVVTTGGEKAWAVFQDASVKVVQKAPKGVLYHEAFHAIFVLSLNSKQRSDLLAEARTMYESPTTAELIRIKKEVADITTNEQAEERYFEEMLAEEFREYALMNGSPANTLRQKVARWFRRLYALGRRLARRRVSVKGLFYDIHNGSYKIKTLPKHAKTVAAYMSQNSPDTLSVTESEQAIRQVNSMVIGKISEIAKEKFGTPRPHIDQVIQVIREYNVDPKNPGEPLDMRNPYMGVAAVYLDVAQTLFNRLEESITNNTNSVDGPSVDIIFKVLNQLVDTDTMLAGDPVLGPLTRSAAIRLFQDYGVKVKVTGGQNEETITAEEILQDEVEPSTEFDTQNDTGAIKESWAVEPERRSKKQTASFRIKFMLSNIQMVGKNLKPITNFMGGPLLVSHSTLYNKLQRSLSIEKGNLGRESMMGILRKIVKTYPEVQAVIDQLETDSVLTAEFLATMTTTNASYIMLLEKIAADGTKEYRLNESNRRSVDKMLLNDWKESLSNIATSPFNEKIMSSKIRKTLATEAIKIATNLKGIRDSKKSVPKTEVQRLSDLTQELGFHTELGILLPALNNEPPKKAVQYLNNYITILTSIEKGINPFEEATSKQEAQSSKGARPANLTTSANQLAYTNAQYGLDLYEAGFANVEKNKLFAHKNPNFISRRIAKLSNEDIKVGIKEKNEMTRDPFFEDNYILRTMFTHEGQRTSFKYAMLDGLKEEGKSKGVTFSNMGQKTLYITTINSWLNNGAEVHGWYKVSTLSDSPSSLYVQHRKEGLPTAKIELQGNIIQEAKRIDRVRDRHAKGVAPIENYDIADGGQGNKFLFFPFMNDVIPKDLKGSVAEWVQKNPTLIGSALQAYMDKGFKDFKTAVYKSGATDELGNNLNIKAIDSYLGEKSDQRDRKAAVELLLETYYWNSVLFNVNMIQITSGDLAFYKSNEDFQKRNKQIYSPGLVIDLQAEFTDEANKSTIVGKTYNNLYLEDNEFTTSLHIDAIKKGLQQSVSRGVISQNDMYGILAKYGYGYNSKLGKTQFLFIHNGEEFTAEKIGGTKTQYNIINAKGAQHKGTLPKGVILNKIDAIVETDGQAYITLDRFKKVYIGLGRWNAQYEQAYKRAKEGKATAEDIAAVFRPLKPFYYGMQFNAQSNLWVPTQNKNSEFVLLPQITKNSKKLDTLLKYMEKNDIDTTNFHTSVKIGAHGVAKWSDIENNKKTVKTSGVNAEGTNIKGNVLIHESSNEDYRLQQETPDHYQNFKIKFGVQIAKLGLADLNHTEGVVYTLQDDTEISADTLVQSFQDNISAGVVMDYYYEAEKFNNIEDLQKFLIQQMRDNGFGDEIESAFEIYESTIAGKKIFKISLNNPLYSNDTEKLLNAAFRNTVTTRKINGGQFVQVSSFGFSNDLKVVKNDKGGIEAFEVMLPWWSKDYFPLKENGEIDFETIQKEAPELLELIGYRIPTEDKYSMAPLRVKGFLPKAAGGAVILPADITTISGSDFDIDKLFVMIPKFKTWTMTQKVKGKDGKMHRVSTKKIGIVKYTNWDTNSDEDLEKIWRSTKSRELQQVDKLIEAVEIAATKNTRKRDLLKKKLGTSGFFSKDIDINFQEQLRIEILQILEGKGKKRYTIHNLKQKRDQLKKMTLEKFKETYRGTPAAFFNSMDARNNHMIDILRSVLQHEDTFDKIMNPGSFQMYKDDRDHIQKLRKTGNRDMNITLPHNDVEFSLRNIAGGKLRGIAANHNTNHAVMQHTDIHLSQDAAIKFWVPNKEGTLGPRTAQSLSEPTYQHLEDGQWKTAHISKNLASIVAMVMDNAKDPVSGDINLNEYTINTFALILRTGFNHRLATIFVAHPLIVEMADNYFNTGATRRAATDVITTMVQRKLMPALKLVEPKVNLTMIKDYIATQYTPSQEMFEKHIENGEAFSRGIAALVELNKTKKDSENHPGNPAKKELYELRVKQGNTLAVEMGYKNFKDLYNTILTKENILDHIAVVSQFDELRTTGDELSRAVGLTRADSTGPGTTMIESTMMVDKYEDIENYPKSIVNLSQLTAPEVHFRNTNLLKSINIPVPNPETGEDFTRTQWMEGAYSAPHTFYEYGVVKPTKLLEQYYIWNTPAFKALREELLLHSGMEAFSAEHIRHINYSLYSYIADGFKFFNSTAQEKTNLVKNFPQELYQFMLDNPEMADNNKLLKRLVVRTDKDHPRIQFDNGSPLSKPEQEEIRRAWQDMFEGEHQELAIKLAKYSFHTLGFIFTPYSFGNLLTNYYYTDVMKHEDMTFDEYILKMRETGGLLEGPNFNEFFDQFMMNHSHQSEYVPAPKEPMPGAVPSELSLTHSQRNQRYFYTDKQKVIHPKQYTSRVYYVEGIETQILFRLASIKYNSKGVPTATYERVGKLGVPNFLVEYRYGVAGNALTSIIRANNISSQESDTTRGEQFFVKHTIKTNIRVGETNITEREAKRILIVAIEGYRAATDNSSIQLDDFVIMSLKSIEAAAEQPSIEELHRMLGEAIYRELPEAHKKTIDNMVQVDASLTTAEQHLYRMKRLGGNMLTNTDLSELSPELKLLITPPPDMGQPKSGNVKKKPLLTVLDKGRVGTPKGTAQVKSTAPKIQVKGTVGSVDNVDMILSNERKVLAVPGGENKVDSYGDLQQLITAYKGIGKPVTGTMVLKGKNGIERAVEVTYHGYGTVNLANTAVRNVDGKAILASLRKSAKNFKLNEAQDRYLKLDTNGNPIPGEEYMRVSEFANGKVEGVSKDAVKIGNTIDSIVRDVMAITTPKQEAEMLTKGHEKYGGDINSDAYFRLVTEVIKLKNKWKTEGKTIISDKIILHSDKMGPNKNEKVAGEIDLMTIDKQGRIEIIDTKSIRNMSNYYDMFNGSTKYDKHSRQVNTYAILLNDAYGLSTSGLSILPVKVTYESGILEAASLIPSPMQPDGKPSDLAYRIELPPVEDINRSRKETWYEAKAGTRKEKSPTIVKSIHSFNEGIDTRHIFTFNTNTSTDTQLDTQQKTSNRVSPIPDTKGIKVKQYISDVKDITPIITNIVRVGSMFGALNRDGQKIKMVINGFTEDQVHLTNISEGKTSSMSVESLNRHLKEGTVQNFGTYPLIEYKEEYYMYDKNTYYPLNPSAELSEEIEKYRKEQGPDNFNSLRSHILHELAGTLNMNKTDNVADLDTEHIAKYCRTVAK